MLSTFYAGWERADKNLNPMRQQGKDRPVTCILRSRVGL